MKLLMLLLSLGISCCFGQITVKNGTSVLVNSGTTLSSKSKQDSIIIESGSIFTNNGVIDLDSTGYIYEVNEPIVGNGYEIIQIPETPPNSYYNFGGLGMEIENNNTIYNLSIIRKHTPFIINSNSSISRSYTLSSQDNNTINLKFNYHQSELNSNIESRLITYKSSDGGSSFYSINSTTDTVSNLSLGLGTNCNGIYTLKDTILNWHSTEEIFSGLSVFPNPATHFDIINIITKPYVYPEINLYSYEGKLIWSHKEKSNSFTLPKLSKGIYFLHLNDPENKNHKFKKIVIH